MTTTGLAFRKNLTSAHATLWTEDNPNPPTPTPGATMTTTHEDHPLAPRCHTCHRRHRPDLPCWAGPYSQRLVKDTIRNKGQTCWLCGKPGATSCDHRIPRSRSGGDELENRYPAHPTCNSERGDNPAPGMNAQLIIITGPPAAGKSTYIKNHAQPGDVTIDLDTLAAALTPPLPNPHDYPDHIARIAQAARAAAIRAAYRLYAGPTIYLIHTNPTPEQRATYAQHGAQFVHLDPGQPTTTARAHADHRPPQSLAYLEQHYATPTTTNLTPPGASPRWKPLQGPNTTPTNN